MAGFNGAWAKTQEGTVRRCLGERLGEPLQWGLGENPGRNARWVRRAPASGGASMGPGRKPRKERRLPPRGLVGHPPASMGPGRKPRKERVRYCIGVGDARYASMGPGRKPRKERDQGQRVSVRRLLQWGLGENPGRNPPMSLDRRVTPPLLQWGLGENPGRNYGLVTSTR